MKNYKLLDNKELWKNIKNNKNLGQIFLVKLHKKLTKIKIKPLYIKVMNIDKQAKIKLIKV